MDSEVTDSLEFYKDKAGEWRWRYRAEGNYEILADSGEGYKSLGMARESGLRVCGLPNSSLVATGMQRPVTRPDGSMVNIVVVSNG